MVNTVLLITSDEFVASMVKESLTGTYEITLVEGGEKAIKCAQKVRPNLVIIDLDFDVLGGIEIVSALRVWTSVPIVFLSNTSEQLIKFYNTEYVRKTEDKASFLEKIESL